MQTDDAEAPDEITIERDTPLDAPQMTTCMSQHRLTRCPDSSRRSYLSGPENARESAPFSPERPPMGDPPGPSSGWLDAVALLGERLARRLDAIQGLLERDARAEATRERVVDRLHAELQEYKQDLLLKVQRPIFIDLIQLHDDIGKMIEARPGRGRRRRGPRRRRPRHPGIDPGRDRGHPLSTGRRAVHRRGRHVRSPATAGRRHGDDRRSRAEQDDRRPAAQGIPGRRKADPARARLGLHAPPPHRTGPAESCRGYRSRPHDRSRDRAPDAFTRSSDPVESFGSRRSLAISDPSHEPSWARSASKTSRAAPRGSASTAGARPAPARTPSATRDHLRGTTRCRIVVSTGAWTRTSRTGLGRSRSLPWFCGSSASSQRSGPSMAQESADPLQLRLRVRHQPREEDRQHRRRSHRRPGRAATAGCIGRSRSAPGMSLDRLAQAHRDPAGRHLVDVLRDQPVDRMPHHIDQLEPRQVAHHPLDRPGIGRQLGVMRARLAAQVVDARPAGTASRTSPSPARNSRRR